MIRLLIIHAYHSRTAGGLSGAEHLRALDPIDVGRLHRSANDTLCRSKAAAWGDNQPENYAKASCAACIRIHDRLVVQGVDVQVIVDEAEVAA